MSTLSDLPVKPYTTAEDIKTSVLGVIGAIQENDNKKHATFTAKSTLKDGLLSNIQIRNFNLTVDEPESLGGTDLGPNPVELILAALGACQEIVIKAYASVLGIEVNSVEVEAKGHLNLKGFFNLDEAVRPGFESVEFYTKIDTANSADQETLQQLLFFAENRCPVFDIVKNNVPVKSTIEYV